MTEAGLQRRVGEWADAAFPASTPRTMVTHLGREVAELRLALSRQGMAGNHDDVPEEAADCYLLLLHLAHRQGFDLAAEAERKLATNRARAWGAPDAEGVVEHVRPAPPPGLTDDTAAIYLNGVRVWPTDPSPVNLTAEVSRVGQWVAELDDSMAAHRDTVNRRLDALERRVDGITDAAKAGAQR